MKLVYLIICLLSSSALASVSSTTGEIKFRTNTYSEPNMTLTSSGLGIGTTSPSANLQVSGNAYITEKNLLR